MQSRVSAYGLSAGDQILVQVGGFGVTSGTGTLNITSSTSSCAGAVDDMFEDNDECSQAVGIGNGTYIGLFTSRLDWDFYRISVDPGSTLAIDASFTHALGDVDIFLSDPGQCVSFSAGHAGCFQTLACSESASNMESLVWTNLTSSTQDYILKVFIWPPTATGDCNNYDLTISGASAGSGMLGSIYCSPNNPNSTGTPGSILVTGSGVVATNSFTATASGLPNGQFAFFIASTTQGFVPMPNASQGNLCLGGNIARFNAQVGMVAGGQYSRALNLMAFPQNPSAPVLPGQTWNFQCWHRDLVGGAPTSNFTDAISVVFL
jgi:hypothetical protein